MYMNANKVEVEHSQGIAKCIERSFPLEVDKKETVEVVVHTFPHALNVGMSGSGNTNSP